MHLLDQVAQASERIAVSVPGDATTRSFPGTDVVSAAVAQCPLRYVLHDDVTETCTELAFEDSTILGTSAELLRVPAPKMWIEFVGSARHKAFSDLGRLSNSADSSCHQRVGLLVTGDERGRRGYIDVCWENLDGLSPDVAPFIIEYDFDDPSFSDVAKIASRDHIGVAIGDHPALHAFFRHVRFAWRPEWRRFYLEKAADDTQYRMLSRQALFPLLEDVPFFGMFCLLLMSRNALQQQATDRRRLNKARNRRGKPVLLDHVKLTMNLGTPASGNNELSSAELWASPRLHFVRGHLVRRGDAVFWRTSHLRGKREIGSIRSRTITLRFATDSDRHAMPVL